MAADHEPEQELKTYRGNCHCGGLVFELSAPDITVGMACNCSICSKKGYLGVFPPSGTVDLIKDDGLIRDYTFGNGNLVHKVSQRTRPLERRGPARGMCVGSGRAS